MFLCEIPNGCLYKRPGFIKNFNCEKQLIGISARNIKKQTNYWFIRHKNWYLTSKRAKLFLGQCCFKITISRPKILLREDRFSYKSASWQQCIVAIATWKGLVTDQLLRKKRVYLVCLYYIDILQIIHPKNKLILANDLWNIGFHQCGGCGYLSLFLALFSFV